MGSPPAPSYLKEGPTFPVRKAASPDPEENAVPLVAGAEAQTSLYKETSLQ